MLEDKKTLLNNASIKRLKIENKVIKIPTTFTKIDDPKQKRKCNSSKIINKNIKRKKKFSLKTTKNKLLLKMLNQEESTMFLVKREVLPKLLLKTAQVKEAVIKGEALTVKDALEEFEITRSNYDKYKDSIFPFYESTKNKVYTFLIEVIHEENILSKIVSFITKHHGNIVFINQGFPLNGIARITMSIETKSLDMNLEAMIKRIKEMVVVREVEIMGRIS